MPELIFDFFDRELWKMPEKAHKSFNIWEFIFLNTFFHIFLVENPNFCC